MSDPLDSAKRVAARFLAASCHATMEHPTDQKLREYLKGHPGADPKKHEVGEPQPKKQKRSPWGPSGKKLQWQDAGPGRMWARFKTDDTRQYSHKYRIQQMGTGEWVAQLESPEGLLTVGAGRTPSAAKQFAQEHMERTIEKTAASID